MQVLVPVQVSGLKPRKDRSWKLEFETGRELSGEEVNVLVEHFQGEGYLQFSPNADIPPPPPEPADAGVKSPAQQQRALLYVLWQQRGSKGSFNSFYATRMEEFNNRIRDLLESED